MKREQITWGVSLVLIFLLISIVSLLLPCKPEYIGGGFFGSACSGELIFGIENLIGAFFIYLVYQGSQAIYGNLFLISISLILNSVIYFFLGVLIRRLIQRKK